MKQHWTIVDLNKMKDSVDNIYTSVQTWKFYWNIKDIWLSFAIHSGFTSIICFRIRFTYFSGPETGLAFKWKRDACLLRQSEIQQSSKVCLCSHCNYLLNKQQWAVNIENVPFNILNSVKSEQTPPFFYIKTCKLLLHQQAFCSGVFWISSSTTFSSKMSNVLLNMLKKAWFHGVWCSEKTNSCVVYRL